MKGGRRCRAVGVDKYRTATALELGRLVADGAFSPAVLTELALGLAAAKPALNAYAFFRREAALREAAGLEAEARPWRLHGAAIEVPR